MSLLHLKAKSSLVTLASKKTFSFAEKNGTEPIFSREAHHHRTGFRRQLSREDAQLGGLAAASELRAGEGAEGGPRTGGAASMSFVKDTPRHPHKGPSSSKGFNP